MRDREINHCNIISAVLGRRKFAMGRQRKKVINFDLSRSWGEFGGTFYAEGDI